MAYFVGITLYGLWVARKTHTSGAYFLGDRKLPWWVMLAQSFSTGTHAEGPVLQAGATYAAGFAAIWYQWKNMLITPFYWLVAPWYRRSQRTTVAEIIEDRYGRTLGLVYTAVRHRVFRLHPRRDAQRRGKGRCRGDRRRMISPNGVVVAMTVVFVVYSLVGGLVATAYTNLVQGFLIIVLSFMLLPAGLVAVGGFSGMRANLPADFFELYNQRSGIDGFTILMLALNGLVGIVAQPHMVSMCATGRSERGGRIGMTYGGGIVKRLCAIGWALTGVIVAAMIVKLGISLKDPCRPCGSTRLTHLMNDCCEHGRDMREFARFRSVFVRCLTCGSDNLRLRSVDTGDRLAVGPACRRRSHPTNEPLSNKPAIVRQVHEMGEV